MVSKKMTPETRLKNPVNIKISKNGPYTVSGNVPLEEDIIVLDKDGMPYEWSVGKKFAVRETYTLCRCGQSKNMPFCDGSHLHTDFDGTETADKKPFLKEAKDIPGPGLDLKDAPGLCVHAGFCDRAFGIWTLVDNSDVPGAKSTAIEEAGNCPSGRLVVQEKDGREIEPAFKPAIGLVVDPDYDDVGPLWVRGCIPIQGSAGTQYEIRNRVTLCRCGKSTNKPFCDGSHRE
jgi:CDGSH-type Zn-finger protein